MVDFQEFFLGFLVDFEVLFWLVGGPGEKLLEKIMVEKEIVFNLEKFLLLMGAHSATA